MVLLESFEAAGARQPKSYLSTGNVSFTTADPLDPALPALLEARISAVISRPEPILIRAIDRLAALIEDDPFAGYSGSDVHERCVTFLAATPTWSEPLPLLSSRGDVEIFQACGPDVFSVTHLVSGRPGTAGPIVERVTGQGVTTRNWRTIERVVANPN